MKIAVSVHVGRAAVGEIGSSDPPAMMAIGEAIDVANELRKVAVAHGVPFAISEPVYTAAGFVPNCEKKITVPSPGREMPIAVFLPASVAALVPAALIAPRSPKPKFLRKLQA
jgi:adenylate cyclase